MPTSRMHKSAAASACWPASRSRWTCLDGQVLEVAPVQGRDLQHVGVQRCGRRRSRQRVVSMARSRCCQASSPRPCRAAACPAAASATASGRRRRARSPADRRRAPPHRRCAPVAADLPRDGRESRRAASRRACRRPPRPIPRPPAAPPPTNGGPAPRRRPDRRPRRRTERAAPFVPHGKTAVGHLPHQGVVKPVPRVDRAPTKPR